MEILNLWCINSIKRGFLHIVRLNRQQCDHLVESCLEVHLSEINQSPEILREFRVKSLSGLSMPLFVLGQ